MECPEEGIDYYVYVTKLPKGIRAMLIPNDDSTYSMYLDYRRSREQWLDDWEHEVWHLLRNDLYNSKPIWVVEAA